MLRALFRLRLGAVLLVLAMNGFYCLKRLRGNTPIDMRQAVVDMSKEQSGIIHDPIAP